MGGTASATRRRDGNHESRRAGNGRVRDPGRAHSGRRSRLDPDARRWDRRLLWAPARPFPGAGLKLDMSGSRRGMRNRVSIRRRLPAQSLVEVACVLPLLMLAGAGVIQFSLWMHAEGVVTAAV